MVQKNTLNKLLIICGPTASGKSDLAVECAKILQSEVISADSLYIYKGLNVGTAKPTSQEMSGILHHLIDVCSPQSCFTVSDYKAAALPIIFRLLKNNKIPVICGGTGFYINSLLYDFSYGNGQGNPEVREKYKKLAIENGNLYVYDILKEKDLKTAEKLHPNDSKRVIRALEIFESGIKKSDIIDDTTPKFDYDAYYIDYTREQLYKRIDERVDKMISGGLVKEVDDLLKNGITIENQCMQGIGYKEIYSYRIGEITLEQAIEKIKLNTRHYAKRQLTFFKRMQGLVGLSPDNPKKNAERICNILWTNN